MVEYSSKGSLPPKGKERNDGVRGSFQVGMLKCVCLRPAGGVQDVQMVAQHRKA